MLAAIVTSVLILTTAAYGMDRQCREDQVKRINNAGEPVCCFTRQCDKNHYFEGCQVDNGQDKCLSCHSGEIFPSSFHTKEFDPNSIHCKVPDCQCFEEAVILNEEECPITGKKICQCDRSKLHFGPDPKNCDTALIPCDRIGIELKRNGKCGPCDPGFEKTKADNSTCVPKSTTTTTEPTKTIIVTGTDGNNLTTESSHHDEGFKYFTVVIPVVAVIIIGIAIVCAVLKCRRRGNINRPRTNGLISNRNVSTRNENSQNNTDIELTVNLIQGGGNTTHENGIISPDPFSPVETELVSDGENTDPKNLAGDITEEHEQRNEECRRLEQRDNESQDRAESESFNFSHQYRGRPVGVAQGQVREHPIDDRLPGNPVAQPNIDDRNAPLYVNGRLLDFDPHPRAPISDDLNNAPSLHSNFDTQDSGIDRATNGS